MLGRDRRVGERLFPWPEGRRALLDVRGRSGKVSAWLAGRGQEPAISDVRQDARASDLPVLVQKDPLRLPAADDSFDAAMLLRVLHHVPEHVLQRRLLIKTLRVPPRVLVREGCPGGALERAATRPLGWVFMRPFGIPTPFTFRTVDGWQKLFAAEGMRLAHEQRYRVAWPALGTFPSAMFVLQRGTA